MQQFLNEATIDSVLLAALELFEDQATDRVLLSSLEPRLSVPDFVSQLWRKVSCETKSGTETLGLRLTSLCYWMNMKTEAQNKRRRISVKKTLAKMPLSTLTKHCMQRCTICIFVVNDHTQRT